MSSEPTPPTHTPRLALTEARQRRGWSQLELAQKLGTTQANVSRWERGITTPGPYFRNKLHQLFRLGDQDLDLSRARSPLAMTGIEHMLYDPAIPDRPSIALVGRDRDLALVKQRLLREQSVGLHGMPGVGKTALAVELANDRQVWEHFSEGVLWAGIGIKPNIVAILSRWGALLGIPPSERGRLSSGEDWSYALRSAIGARRLLIVLDDAWRLENALALQVGGPNTVYLLTTRQPFLAVQFAHESSIVLAELNEAESIDLLRILAPQVVEQEKEQILHLIATIGGLPLALTLVGNYLRLQAHSGQTRRVRNALERLADSEARLTLSQHLSPPPFETRMAAETFNSLAQAIARSDENLDEAAAAALRALSVLPAKPVSFSQAMALAVADCDVETLGRLTDAGLLENRASGRYSLHQTIADYAALHLSDARRQSAHGRLVTYTVRYIEAHQADFEALERENDPILAALEAAFLEGEHAALVRGVIALMPFLLARGYYALAEVHLRRARDGATQVHDELAYCTTLRYLGEIAQCLDNYDQAQLLLEEGLQLARRLGDEQQICSYLEMLGAVAIQRGDSLRAEALLQEGLQSARQRADHTQSCALLRQLGMAADQMGDFRRAEGFYREGLAQAQQIGDQARASALLSSLGVALGQQGNFAEAESCFGGGLALAQRIGHREYTCLLLKNLGAAAMNQGRVAQAESFFHEALSLARQLGMRSQISILLRNLGDLTCSRGDYVRAEAYLMEGVELARKIGHRDNTCGLLNSLGILKEGQGLYAEAEAFYQEALSIAYQTSSRIWILLLHLNLGDIATLQDKFEISEAQLRQALTLAREMDSTQLLCQVLTAYGELDLKMQQIERAATHFQEALELLTSGLEEREELAVAEYGLARVEGARGNLERARHYATSSLAVMELLSFRRAPEVRQWLAGLVPGSTSKDG